MTPIMKKIILTILFLLGVGIFLFSFFYGLANQEISCHKENSEKIICTKKINNFLVGEIYSATFPLLEYRYLPPTSKRHYALFWLWDGREWREMHGDNIQKRFAIFYSSKEGKFENQWSEIYYGMITLIIGIIVSLISLQGLRKK